MAMQGLVQSYFAEFLEKWIYTPPAFVYVVFIAIFAITLILLATEKVNKALAALCGAAATILAGKYFETVFSWVPLTGAVLDVAQGRYPTMKPLLFTSEQVLTEMVDWQTIMIVIALLIVSSTVSRSGLFEYIVVKVIKRGGGDPKVLFVYFCALTYLLTLAMGLIPAFIVIVSLTVTLTRSLGIDPRPYILGELFVNNYAAMSTLIGTTANIVIASHYQMNPSYLLDYTGFLLLGTPFALACSAISMFLVQRSFRESIAKPENAEFETLRVRIMSLDESSLIEDKAVFKRTIILLILMIVGLIIASPLGVQIYIVMLVFAVAFLLLGNIDPRKAIMEVDWELLLFLIGIFIVVGGVYSTGILGAAGEALGAISQGNALMLVSLTITLSSVLSGVLEDVAVAVTLLHMIPVAALSALVSEKAIAWALLYGTKLGSILTPVGETTVILALSILSREGKPISWTTFMKHSVPIMVSSILVGVALIYMFTIILGWNTITPEQLITLLASQTITI